MDEFCLYTFESTHHAIQAEKILSANFEVKLIPVPRQISVSCGLAIRFEYGKRLAIEYTLAQHNIPISKYFRCIKQQNKLEIIESNW